jgi:hypothetical protein
MFPSSFPFFHHHRHGHHGHGGGIYNNLIVNAPQQHEWRHEWRPPYWQQYPMPVIYDINNITQTQGQAQGQAQRTS